MFKWFNKKKKDNKGFTLVELVVVVAILAILVGILAPQYTKYVERSRKAADAANLDSLVTAVKVATADQTYSKMIPTADTATVEITMKSAGTEVKYADTDINDKNAGEAAKALNEALTEYAGNEWSQVTLKSNAWENSQIVASCVISTSGSVEVTYTPASVKNAVKEGK